ncbi:hypothetical protein [Sinorhizobium americanum]|uniref:hypothetical protein n=1 Tax=Sinorhizobium americanum TaxID=194963 RepID=UPI000566B1FB|nr:hypothetical protein [Sinorhizobium americanum]
MHIWKLNARTRLSVEMALTKDRGAAALIQDQDQAAARLGMCGAEIDAARAGRSFDLRGSRALELALGARGNERFELRRAFQAGLGDEACLEIEHLADAHACDSGDKYRS